MDLLEREIFLCWDTLEAQSAIRFLLPFDIYLRKFVYDV